MMMRQEIMTARDCEVVQIPQGTTMILPKGTTAIITQALGDSFTIHVPEYGGLYRIAGKDADVIGQEPPETISEERAANGPVDEALVWAQLRKVYDPEIPVNIVELGLVYDMRIEPHHSGGSRVQITMTLTAPGCGMGQVIAMDAKRLVENIPGVAEADVEIVFDPPWSHHMMSEAARLELGMD